MLLLSRTEALLDLLHQVVLNRTVQLRNPLCAIRVGDTVFALGQLAFDALAPQLSLLFSRLRLDDVWKLNNQIELSAAGFLIHNVEQAELTDKTLHRAVRFIDDRIERILNDGDRRFGQDDLLMSSAVFVVQLYTDMLWIMSITLLISSIHVCGILSFLKSPPGFSLLLA